MTSIVKNLSLRIKEDGTYRDHEFMVEIEIDDDRLAHKLGQRAAVNRNNRSTFSDNMIKCKVHRTGA